MATTAFDLDKTNWTNLGATPCLLQCVGDDCGVVITAGAAPTGEADAHILSQAGETFMNIQITGQTVYARGIAGTGNGVGRVVVTR